MASVTLRFGGQEMGRYRLDKPAMVVGRDTSCDISIDNLGISRTHCQFIKRGPTYIIQDMNSQNGTYVNGTRIGEHYLNDGDEILVAKYTMVFQNEAQAAQQPSADAEDKIVPDSLHTYVMDGKQIRERLSKTPPPGPPGPVAQPATELEFPHIPRKAFEYSFDFDPLKPRTGKTQHLAPSGGASGGLKGLLYVSLATNIALIALVILLVFLMLKMLPPAK